MLMAMLNATMILLAIYKYDTINRRETFEEFWNKKYAQIQITASC